MEPNRDGFRAAWAMTGQDWRGIRSQHRHYPYWCEGTLSTRQPLAADEYPCVDSQYRPYYRFTSVHAWGYRTARQTCTLFCNAGMHVAWLASPPVIQEGIQIGRASGRERVCQYV